jgi:hypothetical protein
MQMDMEWLIRGTGDHEHVDRCRLWKVFKPTLFLGCGLQVEDPGPCAVLGLGAFHVIR